MDRENQNILISAFHFRVRGEDPKAPVFIDGEHYTTLSGPQLTKDFIDLVNTYVERKYKSRQPEISGLKS